VSAFASKVEANYQTRIARTVAVPEWDMVLTVFPMTIAQMAKIEAEDDKFRRLVRIIQVRGKREDGSPMFDEADVDKLCSYGIGTFGIEVVGRVAAEIMDDLPSQEAVAKK
jgi:hypothetical protein